MKTINQTQEVTLDIVEGPDAFRVRKTFVGNTHVAVKSAVYRYIKNVVEKQNWYHHKPVIKRYQEANVTKFRCTVTSYGNVTIMRNSTGDGAATVVYETRELPVPEDPGKPEIIREPAMPNITIKVIK